jgi:hypothetical protein
MYPRSATNKSPELLPIPVKSMDDWANGDPAPRPRSGGIDLPTRIVARWTEMT